MSRRLHTSGHTVMSCKRQPKTAELKTVKILVKLNRIYLKQGSGQKQSRDFQKVNSSSPHWPEQKKLNTENILVKLNRIYLKQGSGQKQSRDFQKVNSSSPHRPEKKNLILKIFQ